MKLSADKTELTQQTRFADGIPVMLETEARTLTTDERLEK